MNAEDLRHALVGDVLASNPRTARVFVDRGMACPGCPFAAFETVAEVAAVYRVNAHDLAAALEAADLLSPSLGD